MKLKLMLKLVVIEVETNPKEKAFDWNLECFKEGPCDDLTLSSSGSQHLE